MGLEGDLTPPDQAERAVGDIITHAGAMVELTKNIRRTGKTFYAQFPAPIDLYALVRLTSPRSLVQS